MPYSPLTPSTSPENGFARALLGDKLPRELCDQVVRNLDTDASGRAALSSLRLVSKATCAFVDQSNLPHFHGRRLLAKAQHVGLADPSSDAGKRERRSLVAALVATRTLHIAVPAVAPETPSAAFPSESARISLEETRTKMLALRERLGHLLELFAPHLGEFEEITLRYSRPKLLRFGSPLDLCALRLGEMPEKLLIALAQQPRTRLLKFVFQDTSLHRSELLQLALDCMPSLKRLEVSALVPWTRLHWRFPATLRELELSNSLVEARDIQHLTGSLPEGLEHLGLAYNRIDSLPSLSHLAALRSLSLSTIGSPNYQPDIDYLRNLPAGLLRLQLVDPPLPHMLSEALDHSGCRAALEQLSLVHNHPKPIGFQTRNWHVRPPSRPAAPEGCSPYVAMDLRRLKALREVYLPMTPHSTADGTRRADPHAHAIHWRRSILLSPTAWSSEIFAALRATHALRAAERVRTVGADNEPTWVFVDHETKRTDTWAPSRTDFPSPLEFCGAAAQRAVALPLSLHRRTSLAAALWARSETTALVGEP